MLPYQKVLGRSEEPMATRRPESEDLAGSPRGQVIHHLLVAALVVFFSMVELRAVVPTVAELERARVWATAHFPPSSRAPKSPAFSFTYDRSPSSQLLTKWRCLVGPSRQLGAALRRSRSYSDPATGLEVIAEVTTYEDFPAIEWVLSFRNSGDQATPLLEDIRAADFRISDGGMNWILHRAVGARNHPSDFAPVEHLFGSGPTPNVHTRWRLVFCGKLSAIF